VLLVGADSYLSAAVIEHYLDQERLLCSGNSDGFIPGEGAGALLLQLPQAGASGLHVLGVGVAQEQATPDGDVPNRAMGLTQAIRLACAQAQVPIGQLGFRLTDFNGEQYFAKEMANACTRVMADAGDDGDGSFPMLHIADGVGETGAAAGVLGLAYLGSVMARADGPGEQGLLHYGNDDGRRTALVVEYR
jgi:3-oxoacyl-[acyl-carrier-protein] synthase-1